MKTHELKTWQPYFEEVIRGRKTFEIRENDRNFKVGERLLLKEFDPDTQTYSGKDALYKITYMTDFAQKENFVVMSITPIFRV